MTTEGIKNGFIADLRAVADHAVRIDNGTVADVREVTDITVLANGDAFTDMRVRLDNRGGMDSRLRFEERLEIFHHLGEGQARVAGENGWLAAASFGATHFRGHA
jgi:hypothetical protein